MDADVLRDRVIANINVCIDFELIKVEVPLIFLGLVGFSTCREGRYHTMSVLYERLEDFGTTYIGVSSFSWVSIAMTP